MWPGSFWKTRLLWALGLAPSHTLAPTPPPVAMSASAWSRQRPPASGPSLGMFCVDFRWGALGSDLQATRPAEVPSRPRALVSHRKRFIRRPSPAPALVVCPLPTPAADPSVPRPLCFLIPPTGQRAPFFPDECRALTPGTAPRERLWPQDPARAPPSLGETGVCVSSYLLSSSEAVPAHGHRAHSGGGHTAIV